MLYKAKTLVGCKLRGIDEEVGKVKDFYFDDHHWAVRYLVVDTGTWLTSRQVLISPYALENVQKEENYIAVDLTKKQIEESPLLSTDKPVSRQFEESYYGYYGWPTYWNGLLMWGPSPNIEREKGAPRELNSGGKPWDLHLRSTSVVKGYNIQALDGEIGHVEDFIIDDATWAIRYLVIDTQNWLPGKKILISPQWIERVSWDLSKVFINLSSGAIKESPEYTEESLVTRDYESGLHRHYHRPEYWGN